MVEAEGDLRVRWTDEFGEVCGRRVGSRRVAAEVFVRVGAAGFVPVVESFEDGEWRVVHSDAEAVTS